MSFIEIVRHVLPEAEILVHHLSSKQYLFTTYYLLSIHLTYTHQ
jgi:hypothetical protein